jgi:hypothetical protein
MKNNIFQAWILKKKKTSQGNQNKHDSKFKNSSKVIKIKR